MADEAWNERYDEYTQDYDEDGHWVFPEESRFGGNLQIGPKGIRVVILRVELSLDPWHVEIAHCAHQDDHSERPTSCLVERFWDDRQAWEAVIARLRQHGMQDF